MSTTNRFNDFHFSWLLPFFRGENLFFRFYSGRLSFSWFYISAFGRQNSLPRFINFALSIKCLKIHEVLLHYSRLLIHSILSNLIQNLSLGRFQATKTLARFLYKFWVRCIRICSALRLILWLFLFWLRFESFHSIIDHLTSDWLMLQIAASFIFLIISWKIIQKDLHFDRIRNI
jgi:hypothetical protein